MLAPALVLKPPCPVPIEVFCGKAAAQAVRATSSGGAPGGIVMTSSANASATAAGRASTAPPTLSKAQTCSYIYLIPLLR